MWRLFFFDQKVNLRLASTLELNLVNALRFPGMMMAMAGFNAQSLQPVIMPFVVGMDTEIAGVVWILIFLTTR